MKLIEELKRKNELVRDLEGALTEYFPDIKWISCYAYQMVGTEHIEEFIVLEWQNGGRCTASNNCNSLFATAQNVTRMLNGGVYENTELYEDIMESEDWFRIA